MQIKLRILENVRKQGAITQRLKDLQEEADRQSDEMAKLAGQMELLDELFAEESGMSIHDAASKDPEFKQQLIEANQAGASLVGATAQKPNPKATKAHSGNKQIGPRPIAPGAEPVESKTPIQQVDGEDESVKPIRSRQPPVVVVTDDPPPSPGDDPGDDD